MDAGDRLLAAVAAFVQVYRAELFGAADPAGLVRDGAVVGVGVDLRRNATTRSSASYAQLPAIFAPVSVIRSHQRGAGFPGPGGR